jgi:amino acid transporter
MTSLVLFAMARDGKLPSLLARVHPRYRTPYMSTLIVALISLAVGLFFASRIDELGRIVNFGALTAFLLLHLAEINHHVVRGGSRQWLRHLVMPLAGLAVISYVLYHMDATAKIMGAAWIAVGVLYFTVLTFLLKKSAALDF